MNNERKYYSKLDVVRIISCIGVLLYHLGLLKGGYLAVSCFFVISGYLSYTSLANKERFSFKEYYKSKLQHIYLPLLVVVFVSICILSFFDNIYWFNLKPETISVILGFNNYWQLSAQADYFARFVSSPFMHFWYIAILLQFDLIFPFLYLAINKIKNHTGRWLPLLLLVLLSIASIIYFYYVGKESVIKSYYLFSTRVYSLLIGVVIGYLQKEMPKAIPKIEKNFIINIIYIEYIIAFLILMYIGDVNTFYIGYMLIATLLSVQLIRYSISNENNNFGSFKKFIKSLASITYEIYLLQYPIIYVFNYVDLNVPLKIILIILIDIVLAIIFHFALSFKDDKYKYYRIPAQILLCLLVCYGLCIFIVAKDSTEEINNLKEQLSMNEKLISKRKKEYSFKQQQEQDNWNKILEDFDNGESQIRDAVNSLAVVGVGDSVMLGAVSSLYGTFPNGYFDAKVSRTDYEANRILQDIKQNGLLSDNIVISLGTNGQCGFSCQEEIVATCEGRNIYWINVTNDYEVYVNDGLNQLAERHSNVTIIDWNAISQDHSEYFIVDGIHLTGVGISAYTSAIYQAIYNKYYNEFIEQKSKVLEEHDKELKTKKSFYGNDTLLNLYNNLNTSYQEADFNIKQNYTFEEVLEDIKNNNNYNIILSIDSLEVLSIDKYLEIISYLEDNHEIYIIFVYNSPYSFENKNVHVIDFYSELNKNSNYWAIDHKHFSETGNKALEELINNSFLNEKRTITSKGSFFIIFYSLK